MTTFSDLGLDKAQLNTLTQIGFKNPSEIQEKSIPYLLSSDGDFIGQAQTGTGKTAAFALPLIARLDHASDRVQTLILAPTRELANQICEEIHRLSAHAPLKTQAVYGGKPISGQIKDLKFKRPQIVVGTPGRVIDLLERKALRVDDLDFLVLDEADEMLDMGFFEDVQTILSHAPSKRHIWMFSATMPKPILNLVQKEFRNPEIVKVTKKVLTNDKVDQQYVLVKKYALKEALFRYLSFHIDSYSIIFTRTKLGAQSLSEYLNERGLSSDSLHGDMSQEARDFTMKRFKEKKLKTLVCTDVAARGIDVSDLTHVVNFELPQDDEAYVHRIGRTGRAGVKGVAISLIERSEFRRLKAIERKTQAEIRKVSLPSFEDLVSQLDQQFKLKMNDELNKETFDDQNYVKFETEFKELFQEVSRDDLLTMMYRNFWQKDILDLHRKGNLEESDEPRRSGERSNSQGRRERSFHRRGERSQRFDENNSQRRSSRRRDQSHRGPEQGHQRFRLSVGRNNGIEPGGVIRMVASNFSIKGANIGRIKILDNQTFFEIPDQYAQNIRPNKQLQISGQQVSVQLDSSMS